MDTSAATKFLTIEGYNVGVVRPANWLQILYLCDENNRKVKKIGEICRDDNGWNIEGPYMNSKFVVLSWTAILRAKIVRSLIHNVPQDIKDKCYVG